MSRYHNSLNAGHIRSLRRWLVIAGLAVTLPLLAVTTSGLPGTAVGTDFVAYWSAGRLNLAGANPYADDGLLRLEHEAGWAQAEQPMRLWNPPWLLALVMPFSLLPYPVGRLLWLSLNIGTAAFCADWCWRYYGGPPRYRRLALVGALAFAPALMMVKFGQISPLLLLGLIGFLRFERQRRWFLAGLSASLVLIKPQLLFLFLLAFLLWAISQRRWAALLGMACGSAGATLIAWLPNPAVITHYLASLENSAVWNWMPHTPGGLLRLLLGVERNWLMFALAPLGVVWLLLRWRRHGARWEWAGHMPALLLVCLITAPYGWVLDEVILLLPMLQALAGLLRLGRRPLNLAALAFYVAFDVIMLLPGLVAETSVWYPLLYAGLTLSAPLLGAAYWLARRQAAAAESPAAGP